MEKVYFRLNLALGLGLLALCAAYAALVLHSATWEQARAIDAIFPFYGWHIQPFTAAAFARIQKVLGITSAALAAFWALANMAQSIRAELASLAREIAQSWAGLVRGLTELTTTQRRQGLAALAILTGLRLYFSIYNPEYDDAVSYVVFVSKGLLATASYYPIPNNHVFSNTISWLFYQLNPGFWWSMRLPVLLISTVATVFLFAALLRRANSRVAMLAGIAFSCLQLSLYHAGVGRGYWLIILLAGVVFFSLLELLSQQGRHRAAWAAIMVAGVAGCYTVPTFLYVLASAFSWLGLTFLRQKRFAMIVQLGGLGLLIGLATAVLYAPLLFVSGLFIFTRNGYVATLAPGVFWPLLPGYLWHNEGFLAGQRTLGTFITLGVLGLLAWIMNQARNGRLPADQARRLRVLGFPALWFVAFPYAMVLVQRVFPPERVLLYKAFFFFILAGLVVDWVLWRWPRPAYQWPQRALLALIGLFIIYQVLTVVRVNPGARGSNANYHAGVEWLAAHSPGPVLIPEPTHNLFFQFYAHNEHRSRAWQIDYQQQANTRYAYVVAFPNKRGYFQPQFNFPPAFQNNDVEIYIIPKGFPLATDKWRH